MRQPKFADRRFKQRPRVLFVQPVHGLAAQQVAAVGVGYRQRVAAASILAVKVSFEIRAPNRIGGFGGVQAAGRRSYPLPFAALGGEAGALQDLADGAGGGPMLIGLPALQPSSEFFRAPPALRPARAP